MIEDRREKSEEHEQITIGIDSSTLEIRLEDTGYDIWSRTNLNQRISG